MFCIDEYILVSYRDVKIWHLYIKYKKCLVDGFIQQGSSVTCVRVSLWLVSTGKFNEELCMLDTDEAAWGLHDVLLDNCLANCVVYSNFTQTG